MTPEQFKEEVQEAVDFYLTDYFTPEIEWDCEDPEDLSAIVKIELRDSSAPYFLTLHLDVSGDLGVECAEDSYLSPDDGGLFTCLFFEAHGRAQEAQTALDAAKKSLESVKDRMDEHAYQELASALNP